MADQGADKAYREAVVANVAYVSERIEGALARSGRPADSVVLMAVTKFQPASALRAAFDAGLRVFGENRVQEAELKLAELGDLRAGISVHMIGHLQGNKAAKAASLFDAIQSIDSKAILRELDKRAGMAGRVVDLLFELRTGEESKSGFATVDELLAAVELAVGLKNVRPKGLMTMAPFTDVDGAVRAAFKDCGKAFRRAGEIVGGTGFDILSMGMSGDFETAIEEGSTMVRIGTALFGARASI